MNEFPGTGYEDYDNLPPIVRWNYTLDQWLVMSDWQKATLVQRETEPECPPSY